MIPGGRSSRSPGEGEDRLFWQGPPSGGQERRNEPMNLFEYEGKRMMAKFAIPTPGSRAAIEKALDILGGKASDYGLVYNPAAGNYEYRGRGGKTEWKNGI